MLKLFHYFKLARLHKPLPILLIYLPCLWGIALCSPPYVHFIKWGVLFAFGALCMRSAGCIFNDLCDITIDQKVARTKERPLAAGALSKKEALIPFIFFLSGGLGVFFFLNTAAKIISLVGLALLFLYPFTKRFFVFPQLILGFAFNIGALVAVAQLQPFLLLKPQPWILYGIGIFWTLYYDTIYAVQDLKEDLLIGVHSTAVFFRHHLRYALAGFYLVMNMLMAFLGVYLGADIWFYGTLVFGIIFDIFKDIRRFDASNTREAERLFHHAIVIGIAIFILILFPEG